MVVACYDHDVKQREAKAAHVKKEPAKDFDQEAIDHDDSLIRWMLGLNPTQRLAVVQGFVDSVRILRSGRRTPPRQKFQAVEYEDRIELVPSRPITEMRGFLRGIDTTIERE